MARENAFKKIYASSFYYDSDGVVKWPAQVISYTNKTQFLFRIEKGVLDINDDRINDYFPPEEIRVPFRNMVYIGDSATDIPCMKLVNTYGGYSIGVYNPNSKDKSKVYSMVSENRIKYFSPADYSQGSELEELIKSIIDRTQKNELLENKYYEKTKEVESHIINQAEGRKNNLIDNLVNSRSYAATHTVIAQLIEVDSWNEEQLGILYEVACRNGQVSSIIGDTDVKLFYKTLLKQYEFRNEDANSVEKRLDG